MAMVPLIRADEPPATPVPAAPAAGEHHRGDRGAMRANRLKMLDEKLSLTDAQKQQITAIWASSEQQGKALRNDDTLSKEDRRAKMGEIMKASHDQIRALLTPDQQKTFDAMPPPERGHHGPHKGAGDKPAADAPPKQ